MRREFINLKMEFDDKYQHGTPGIFYFIDTNHHNIPVIDPSTL
jgi:hypothetical protein